MEAHHKVPIEQLQPDSVTIVGDMAMLCASCHRVVHSEKPCLTVGGVGKLRDELLNGEIFYSLAEAAVLVEQWRREYNTVRPHSACGGFPPAPEAIKPSPWFLRMPVLHGPPQVLGLT